MSKSLAGRFTCLGTYFSEAGYETAYFGKWHTPIPIKEPAAHGFQTTGAIKNNGVDSEIPGLAIEFIRRTREAPFFLVTSFVNPHNICEWARGDALPDGAVGEPPEADHCPPVVPNASPMKDETDTMVLMRRSMQASPMFPVGDFDEAKWRQYRWAYFRMVERVDGYLSRIVSALEETGILQSTVIVFMSDHGDMQGMHGWNQKTVFYDNASRVPFMIAHPSYPDPRESDRLVNTGLDLLPTLLEIGGIPRPSTLPGMSLFPSVRDEQHADPRTYIVSQSKMVQGAPIDGKKPEAQGRMVRTKRFKYCVYDFGERRESLVDMERDPGETQNVAEQKEYVDVLLEHRRILAEFCKTTGDEFPYVS
jgi:choline-sulfatase